MLCAATVSSIIACNQTLATMLTRFVPFLLFSGRETPRFIQYLGKALPPATFGMLVMGPIPGILADRFGSYVPAYAFFALCQLVLTLIIQGIYFKLDLGKRPVRT